MLEIKEKRYQDHFFINFFTNCPQMQPAPFHESHEVKLLGRPLFREGASAFMLNSGVESAPMYFQGVLTEFTFHTGQDAIKAPCKSVEVTFFFCLILFWFSYIDLSMEFKT
ncbi:unnamed protein product [Hymenolepis diminuta]|uniref:DUF5739 domain-containing protein n=1 Tax=Hymenolepis diminuta TaxID=6216 RepID=A0A0R3SL96_HYMDI|nr:unnamed protein product [Hymenolepis diminuta]